MNWPLSQLVPLNPLTQEQLYEFTPSVQFPSFRQGFGKQLFMSVELIKYTFQIFFLKRDSNGWLVNDDNVTAYKELVI